MTDHPIRIAVIGSGPAGFYAAGHLLKESDGRFEVDMLERLPTPWGLVRSGVAPDHPKIKSVTRIYEKTAAHPRFRYFGNVSFGEHVGREDLLAHYHAIVYATGSPSDRPLGIPGEELHGSHAATDFVGWYNGHPDQCDLEIDLLSAERAVVIGNGNVALDVARMLVLAPSELAPTDTADHALEVLADSRVREVVVVGRRGPAQAAFTNPELLELGELSEADVIVDPAELDRALAVHDPAAEANATSRKNVEILKGYASRTPKGHAKRIVLRFLLSPTALLPDEEGRLGAVELVRNELVPAAGGALRAQASDERETIPAGLAFRAIGYRGIPLPGVPFDERGGVIPNAGGRVIDLETGEPVPGEYVVGWIKRGPSGVIGTNKKDAQETVDAMLADLLAAADGAAKHAPEAPDPTAVESLLRERQPELVTYAGWTEIDKHERALGEPAGRPRVKLTRIEEMLRVAASQSPSEESLEEVEAG
ncbi:MAG: FAD-dependent pyridine nucleotide-disulfide oxidoreductase [Solirubrobacterales bacterium]|nr:FAD-dependent pyridine nucleotide-disulfide oxidoreductase [Solirubrobacterales bacterium]